MNRNLLLLSFALCSMGNLQSKADNGLVINELMQSNVECLMDDTKEFPDSWVELFNAGDAAVNLKDYKIGDCSDAAEAWQLPDKTIEARSHVLVYCDKQKSGLHTSFRLESDKGCKVYLFCGDEIIDKVEALPKMPAPDVAYGRTTDGSDEWGYQLTSTPGSANTGEVCDAAHILGAPVFSELGRVKSSSSTISLKLSLPEDSPEGTVIRYTTDGSEPTTDSKAYANTIRINKTTVVRAKLFCEGWLSPLSTAQSYIFHPRTMTLPIFSVVTNDKYLYDKSIGLIANNNSKADKKTHDWRRPVNIEFFPAEDEPSAFNQHSQTRIQGGQSRANALKSMVFYANKRFDQDNKRFTYEFFPDQKPGLCDFKSFSLRDGGNDFSDLYFRDAIIQRTMGAHTDIDWQACRSAVLYINGEYMGMLNIRERSNADNIYSNYDHLEDIDMVEISHEQENGKDLFIEELKEGTDECYEAFKTFYSEKGHTRAEYEEWLDVGEYLSVMAMNLFYGNIDFPGNNLVYWRPNDKATDCTLPKRWRVIVKDTDFGLGLYGRANNYNTINLMYNPQSDSNNAWAFTEPATRLFLNMMDNDDLRQLFIDKCCVFMGDFMNGRGTSATIDLIKDEAIEEFVAHRDKYNAGWGWWPTDNRADITNKFNEAKKWVEGRPSNFYKHLGDHYGLGSPIPLTVNKGIDSLPDSVAINGINLSEGCFDGKYFPECQLLLSAVAPEGMTVRGWKVVTTPTSGNIQTQEYEGSLLSLTMPVCKQISIEALLGTDTGISTLSTSHEWRWQRTDGGIRLSSVPAGQQVSLYNLSGVLQYQTVATGGDILLPATDQIYLLKVGSQTIKVAKF